jgi:hypothetical protein
MVPPNITSALDIFDRTAEQLFNSFAETLSVPWPPILYHYTNDIGLRGILETGTLWLTDMFNLNDPSELSHGISHLVNILNNKAVDGPSEAKNFAQLFAQYLKHGGYEKFAHYFVGHSLKRATILGSGELMRIMGAAMLLVLMQENW